MVYPSGTAFAVLRPLRLLVPAMASVEDIIRKWQGADEDVLDIVQRQADACGLQVLSFYASPQEKSRYHVELSGAYGSYIHFFNQMEREGPLFSVSLERMERCGDAVLAVIKI